MGTIGTRGLLNATPENEPTPIKIEFDPNFAMYDAAGISLSRNPHGELQLMFWKDQQTPVSAGFMLDIDANTAMHSVGTELRRYFKATVTLPWDQLPKVVTLLQRMVVSQFEIVRS